MGYSVNGMADSVNGLGQIVSEGTGFDQMEKTVELYIVRHLEGVINNVVISMIRRSRFVQISITDQYFIW